MDQTGAGSEGAAAQRRRLPDDRRRLARVTRSIALGALTTMVAAGAHAQAPARPATPAELEQQVTMLREQLRTMQEQQRGLTEALGRLQQQLAAQPAPAAPSAAAAP